MVLSSGVPITVLPLDVTHKACITTPRMNALRTVGVPYTDEQIAASAADVKGKTEMDALVAYLQVMGRALK